MGTATTSEAKHYQAVFPIKELHITEDKKGLLMMSESSLEQLLISIA